MPIIPDILEANYTDFPVNDFIVEMQHAADKQETHEAFQGQLPEYVTKAARLREIADELGKARDAAAGGDRDRSAEKKALLAAGQLALSMNANHITMLSLARNNPGLLANCGYELKQKSSNKSVNLLDFAPEVFAKHGNVSGALVVMAKRAKSSANIELQVTDQDPTIEASWRSLGMYNRSRIELKGLEPAKKLYFRARYHEDGNVGNWSSPVCIIVL